MSSDQGYCNSLPCFVYKSYVFCALCTLGQLESLFIVEWQNKTEQLSGLWKWVTFICSVIFCVDFNFSLFVPWNKKHFSSLITSQGLPWILDHISYFLCLFVLFVSQNTRYWMWGQQSPGQSGRNCAWPPLSWGVATKTGKKENYSV